MDLSERIKQSRKKSGLTQAQLAKLSGVSSPVIHDLEAGKSQGSSHLVKIASVLNVSPNWLYSGTEDHGFSTDNLSERELALIRNYRLLNESDRKIMERIASSLNMLK